MAIFSDKVVSTKFIDPPNNMIIEVLYREGDETVPYVLEVDFTSEDFNSLLQEVTLDEIESNTVKLIKAEQYALESVIQNEIERRWEEEQGKIKAAYDEAEGYAHKVIEREIGYFSEEREKLQTKFSLMTTSNTFDGKGLFSAIEKYNQDNDFVFTFKVSILEDPLISKSKDKNLKLAIRKSKSLLELLKIYAEIKEAN